MPPPLWIFRAADGVISCICSSGST
jgi:hypothetical protein